LFAGRKVTRAVDWLEGKPDYFGRIELEQEPEKHMSEASQMTRDKSKSARHTPAEDRVTRDWSDKEILILEAARKLIAHQGYHSFSMRRVANRSGIHLKSLQYYFRTKQDMLNAVVNYTIEKYYFGSYGRLFLEKSAGTAKERFSLMIDHLLDDLSDPLTAKLFPELWALANHDTAVKAAMDLFYVRHLASLEAMILQLKPSLGEREAKHRAALIGMMIEGLVLILGYGKPKHDQYTDLQDAAKEMILCLVLLPPQNRESAKSLKPNRNSSTTAARLRTQKPVRRVKRPS
jgi:AcrR family transcriptional regulator